MIIFVILVNINRSFSWVVILTQVHTKMLCFSFSHLFYVVGRMQVKPNKQPVIVSVPICHYDGQLHFLIYLSGATKKRKRSTLRFKNFITIVKIIFSFDFSCHIYFISLLYIVVLCFFLYQRKTTFVTLVSLKFGTNLFGMFRYSPIIPSVVVRDG